MLLVSGNYIKECSDFIHLRFVFGLDILLARAQLGMNLVHKVQKVPFCIQLQVSTSWSVYFERYIYEQAIWYILQWWNIPVF